MRIEDLIPAVYVLGITGVIGGIMLTVMTSLSLTGAAALFIGNATTGMTNLAAQLGLVGTVVALAVALGVVIMGFGGYVGLGRREG
jgi:hypothetical protein